MNSLMVCAHLKDNIESELGFPLVHITVICQIYTQGLGKIQGSDKDEDDSASWLTEEPSAIREI